MDRTDCEEIKTHILTEITKVEKDILSLAELSRPVEPDNAIGRLTRMEAITSRGISEAKLKDARSRLILLKNALARTATQDFGNCRDCGDPIQFARLKLLPEATMCIECAQG